jgi:hypothetical protein
MGIVSKLICEYPLPIPFEKFTKEEEKRFKKVKWDELDFFTSSFFYHEDGLNVVSTYTISEDGQFYKSNTTLEVIHDEKGGVELKEIDDGIERQDFTGEIHFGTEFLEDEYDYVITFKALLYKGDVKELELYEWEKVSNKGRKEASKKFSDALAKIAAKKKSLWHSIISPFKRLISFVVYLIRWALSKVFHALGALERWIVK